MPVENRADLGAAQGQPEVATLASMYGIDGEPTRSGRRFSQHFQRKIVHGGAKSRTGAQPDKLNPPKARLYNK
jgi:hypothetical protein